MADVNENLLNDLLTRVQKIENSTASNSNMQEYLTTLDRVAFSMTIAIDVISKVLIDKGLVTKEELNKSLETQRDEVTKELTARMAEQTKA